MNPAEVVSSDVPWKGDFENAVVCPACEGSVIGATSDSNSHLTKAWVGNLKELAVVLPEGRHTGPHVIESHDHLRGSVVAWECVFEQCMHVVQYRVRFHKGDVYLEWRVVGKRPDSEKEEDFPPCLPRS